ncbi:prepilin-type N-terminal cleavage/methylation domain-containing protein [Acuticoccus yangtzensis]|uniref:prepilin-type N-terminal cleavage/methylation domain-containing protein n=1 Tax=Acuticoccus yangtzensis TaxID=1443441 RepID=UPI0009F97687|nr:prepilin-type N-terminal cleavage/methylation domain-containing protein [Acuticoccus yangtzensis]
MTRRRACGVDGFTLVEVLVALAVLAAVGIAIQRGIVAATGTVARAAEVASAERVARTLLDTPLPPGAALAPRSGTAGPHRWTMRFEPLAFAPARVGEGADSVTWSPVRVRLTVSAGAAAPVTVETVRLVADRP